MPDGLEIHILVVSNNNFIKKRGGHYVAKRCYDAGRRNG